MKPETKKVLILAYDFPPYTSMGGQRPFGWFSYFKQFGIEPTVITRQWPHPIKSKIDYSRSTGTKTIVEKLNNGTLIKVPYKANFRDRLLVNHGFEKHAGLRKALTLSLSILQHISSWFDNKSPIFKEAKQLLKTEEFDAVIATGEPFILFRYAYKLNKSSNIKWFADYRDCWSDNFVINQNGGINKLIHHTFFRKKEKKYVKSASGITTAAPIFKEELAELFPHKDISVIYNGFVDDDFADLPTNNAKNKELTIAFAGTIYEFQPVEIFLEGIKRATEKANISIKAVFYGSNFNPQQKERIMEYDNSIHPYIETTDRLNQDELFKKMNSADVLLLFDNKGMISGKLYEYLALRKTILMAGRDHGSMEKIITDTKSGIICPDGNSVADALLELYGEWGKSGTIPCHSVNIEQYSRKEQTKKLAELLLL